MPCLRCNSPAVFTYNGQASSFCQPHFKEMFPKAYRTTTLPTAQEVQDEVARVAMNGELAYVEGDIKYSSQIEDNRANMSKRMNGRAPKCLAKGKVFTPEVGKTPSQAIFGFFEGETVCECHNFVMAVFFRAICNLVGDRRFDAAFHDLKIQVSIDFEQDAASPLKKVLTSYPVDADGGNVAKGDWIYVRNRDAFGVKHPGHEAVGWNLICVSEGDARRFIGLGLGHPEGLSLPGIFAILDEEFEKPPRASATAFNKSSMNLDMLKVKSSSPQGRPHVDTSIKGRRIDVAKLRTLLG